MYAKYSQTILNNPYFLTIFILVSAVSLCFFSSTVSAEKTPVLLTLTSVPEDPAENHGFHVIGTLSTAGGEILGNKRVILESSQVTPQGPGNFTFLAIGVSNRQGVYDFFRPKNTPPEYLRISFAGNEEYESASSPVLPVRGAGTVTAERSKGIGSLTVNTDPIGAGIYVDSEFKGITPAVIQGIEEGPHQVEVGLEGYQNESMEMYISPDKGSTFSITLNPEGLGRTGTGLSSQIFYQDNKTATFGEPAFSLDYQGISMRTYTNATGDENSTSRHAQVTTIVSNDTINDGYNVMVIMTDH